MPLQNSSQVLMTAPVPLPLESPDILHGFKWGQVCSNNLSKHGALRETLPATLSRTGTSNIPQRKENNKKTQSFASGFFSLMYRVFLLNFFSSWLKITGSRPSTRNQLHTLRDLLIKILENLLKICSENFAIPYTCATADLGAPPGRKVGAHI